MAREFITRCDKCGETEGVRTYRVQVDGEDCEIDLDDKHASPILNLMKLGRPTSTISTVRGGRERREMERLIRAKAGGV